MSIDKIFINSFIKATERAAYGASLFVGKGDKIAADKGAVDEMRNQLNKINMKGKIVIGEGEMDEAPMLYINEVVGNKKGDEFDIAVDPLEGTNFAAKNLPNALSVLAVSNKGNLLQAPDMYMEKIAIGPNLPKNIIDQTTFEHPVFSLETLKAQKELYKIQGKQNTYFCGSYFGYGFHEDGIQSAANLCKYLDVDLPWKRNKNFISRVKS